MGSYSWWDLIKMATGRNRDALPVALSGGESFVQSSHSRELSVSFALTAAQKQQIISCLFGNGPTSNGMSEIYDQSTIDHALHVRKQRDAEFLATTSRDTEPSKPQGES